MPFGKGTYGKKRGRPKKKKGMKKKYGKKKKQVRRGITMANNEITLGDNQPLSNDLKPIKVGGEASILNVSSPTPDGSVDGEVEVKGKLRAKDTIIQGDLKVFSDSDTSPQFRFQSKQGKNCQFILESAANTLTQLSLKNNQGSWNITTTS